MRLSLACAALLACVAAAQERPAVEALYGEVEAAFSSGRWSHARQKLVSLVKEHERADYLVARSAALVGMMTECDFRKVYKVPGIQQFLRGSVKSFNKDSSELQVRYAQGGKGSGSTDTLAGIEDFEVRGKQLRFRVPFAGDHQVVVTGKLPPMGSVGRQPEIIACQSEEMSVRFLFTWPTTSGPGRVFQDWTLGAVFLEEDGKERRLEEDAQLGIKYSLMYGETYDLKVSVNKSTVAATIHGIKFLSADRPAGDYGALTIGWCPGVSEIVIKGTIDPAWVDAAFKAHEAAERARFLETYDPAAALPAWLCDASVSGSAPPAAGESGARPDGSALPGSGGSCTTR